MRRISSLLFLTLFAFSVATTAVAAPDTRPAAAPVVDVRAAAPVDARPAAPTMAAPAAPAMDVVPVAAPQAAPPAKEKSIWTSASFWGSLVGALTGVALIILGAFGITKKINEQERWVMIIKSADKAIDSFKTWAATTDANWDDIVAAVLKSVSSRFVDMTEQEKAKLEAVIETRREEVKADVNKLNQK